MTEYQYKVVPAPRRGRKGRGIKGAEARFAYAIQELMNEYSSDGWEFLRAETLASEERHGLASAQTVYRDLLVFRRPRAAAQPALHVAAVELEPEAAAAVPPIGPAPDPARLPEAAMAAMGGAAAGAAALGANADRETPARHQAETEAETEAESQAGSPDEPRDERQDAPEAHTVTPFVSARAPD